MPKFAGIRGQTAANRLSRRGGRGLILPKGGKPVPLPPPDWNELQTEAEAQDGANRRPGTNAIKTDTVGFQFVHYRTSSGLGETRAVTSDDAWKWGEKGLQLEPRRTNYFPRAFQSGGTGLSLINCTGTNSNLDGAINNPREDNEATSYATSTLNGTGEVGYEPETVFTRVVSGDQTRFAYSLCISTQGDMDKAVLELRSTGTPTDHARFWVDFAAGDVYHQDLVGPYTFVKAYFEPDYIRGYRRAVVIFDIDSGHSETTLIPNIRYKKTRDNNLDDTFTSTDVCYHYSHQLEICENLENYATSFINTGNGTGNKGSDRTKYPWSGSFESVVGTRDPEDLFDDGLTPMMGTGSFCIEVTFLVDRADMGSEPFGNGFIGLLSGDSADDQSVNDGKDGGDNNGSENQDSLRSHFLHIDNSSIPQNNGWRTKGSNAKYLSETSGTELLWANGPFAGQTVWIVINYDGGTDRTSADAGYLDLYASGGLRDRVKGFGSWGSGNNSQAPDNNPANPPVQDNWWMARGGVPNLGLILGYAEDVTTSDYPFIGGAQIMPFVQIQNLYWWKTSMTDEQAKFVSRNGPEALLP